MIHKFHEKACASIFHWWQWQMTFFKDRFFPGFSFSTLTKLFQHLGQRSAAAIQLPGRKLEPPGTHWTPNKKMLALILTPKIHLEFIGFLVCNHCCKRKISEKVTLISMEERPIQPWKHPQHISVGRTQLLVLCFWRNSLIISFQWLTSVGTTTTEWSEAIIFRGLFYPTSPRETDFDAKLQHIWDWETDIAPKVSKMVRFFCWILGLVILDHFWKLEDLMVEMVGNCTSLCVFCPCLNDIKSYNKLYTII